MKTLTTAALSFVAGLATASFLALAPAGAVAPTPQAHGSQDGPIRTPQSIRDEHEHLHRQLAAAIEAGGETGAAAQRVKDVMRPHFQREEQIAMPPLGLLESLSQGEVSPEMKPALRMTMELREEMPSMLAEHDRIKQALKDLEKAARSEGKLGHAEFAEKLILHARHEEDVLYPAALLVGRHLEMVLND